MIVTERTQIPDAALPLDAFKAHLRLGRGFGTESLQDALLLGFLRASLAAIETRIGKVLITRDYTLNVNRWRDPSVLALPLVPVTAVTVLVSVDRDGGETLLDAGLYTLNSDAQVAQLRPTSVCLPSIPVGGHMRVEFTAGLATGFDALAADLVQAVMMLAAHYYEHRDDTGLHRGCMPFGVTSLIERHRVLRLALGGRA
ncbi:head-tail connector protein [Epibacterium ulvae]|uniref:head-tail connector protein n=1 Tax=Epibacterium ulvae TaxID=1156985 RepID=UPI001BFCC036|nr:head-tail connector protein [Epibacterium ulvae]MBT8152542.1 head-tail connector protein [Epibacterium ulvae]